MTTHELNWGSNTAPVLPIHSAFSPLTSHNTTCYWSSDPSVEIFFLPPNMYCALLSLAWIVARISPRLSSNLHSTLFQNWILTHLKYLLPESLQHIIHPFKASHWFPIFWQRFKCLFCLSQWCCSLMNSFCIWTQCSFITSAKKN